MFEDLFLEAGSINLQIKKSYKKKVGCSKPPPYGGGWGRPAVNPDKYIFTRGNKFFELGNHLGNVLVTVSDKKKGIDTNGDNNIDFYVSDIVTAIDYYPFGMSMPGRKWSAGSLYRYGFNGKENDNEVKGEGNQQDYGMRIYDPRVGRFLSVDPIAKSFPYYTPYQYAGNMPIYAIDMDGQEPVSALRFLSRHTSQIMGVSWGAQYNAVTHTVGIANGVAVDPNGNVLAFTQAGGLAATINFLQGGKSGDVSIGVSVGFSVYNDRVTQLQDLLGTGKTLTGGVGFLSGGAEFSDDMEMQGATIQLGYSFGRGAGYSAQNTKTTGTIFSKEEYDHFKSSLKIYERVAQEEYEKYNYDQTVAAGEEYRKKNFPYYTRAIWQVKAAGFDVSYEEVGENRFEIVYKTYYTIYAQQAVVSFKGFNPTDYTKETKVEFIHRSRIYLTKDPDGNYISEAYQRQFSGQNN